MLCSWPAATTMGTCRRIEKRFIYDQDAISKDSVSVDGSTTLQQGFMGLPFRHTTFDSVFEPQLITRESLCNPVKLYME